MAEKTFSLYHDSIYHAKNVWIRDIIEKLKLIRKIQTNTKYKYNKIQIHHNLVKQSLAFNGKVLLYKEKASQSIQNIFFKSFSNLLLE